MRLRWACAWGVIGMGLASASSGAFADPPGHEELRRISSRITARPADAALLLRRAEELRSVGRHDDALADLRMAEALGSSDNRLEIIRAEVLADAGRDHEAVRSLDGFLSSRPEGRVAFRALWLKARLHERSDQHELAVSAYEAALVHGDDVQAHLERARLLERLGRLSRAADAYSAGVEATGGAAVLVAGLVHLESRRGNHDRALDVLAPLLRAARAKTRWLLLRADVLERGGRSEEARAERARALREAERISRRRRSASALLDRARALSALGLFERALADVEQALRRAPHLREARGLRQRLYESAPHLSPQRRDQ